MKLQCQLKNINIRLMSKIISEKLAKLLELLFFFKKHINIFLKNCYWVLISLLKFLYYSKKSLHSLNLSLILNIR